MLNTGEPIYVICAPFTGLDESERFLDYQQAVSEAKVISKYAREIQIQIRLFRETAEERGELVAACQNGEVLQAVQTSLFNRVNGKVEQKYQSSIGKVWWKVIEQYTDEIRSFRSRLTPKTEEEQREMKAKQRIQQGLLEHLKNEMPKEMFLAAKWKFVDCTEYKNREAELPEEIQNYSPSSVRKFYNSAYVYAGKVAICEHWMLNESAQTVLEQFLGAFLATKEPETSAAPELKVVARNKRPKKVSFEPIAGQISLFEMENAPIS